jgi:hypothetical protein
VAEAEAEAEVREIVMPRDEAVALAGGRRCNGMAQLESCRLSGGGGTHLMRLGVVMTSYKRAE